ncbi:DEAD/DEAH box helicase, partial [Myxococcota bacterium]|nr:DEAD/DEAH box helicase [Myxococcota bacterium]
MFDALKAQESIRKRLNDFCLDDLFVNDGDLREALKKLWLADGEDGGLTGRIWVEDTGEAEGAGKSLADLVNEENPPISKALLEQLKRSQPDMVERNLYKHQEEAIRAVAEAGESKPAVVITAPTGSGKTESFLLPALSGLFSEPRSKPGMRCLVLYPMNALVMDQVDRLDSWLAGQSEVKLFHFTSGTPEDKRARNSSADDLARPHRVDTRQQARCQEAHIGKELLRDVPDIVVTNYSMLEYMLSRPQDGVFFGEGLDTIILDEAHLYNGTLALEIQLLLRRVIERCGVKPEDVLVTAASATLGANKEELTSFFAKLTSKSEDRVTVVRGERVSLRESVSLPAGSEGADVGDVLSDSATEPGRTLDEKEGVTVLKQSPEECERLVPVLEALAGKA